MYSYYLHRLCNPRLKWIKHIKAVDHYHPRGFMSEIIKMIKGFLCNSFVSLWSLFYTYIAQTPQPLIKFGRITFDSFFTKIVDERVNIVNDQILNYSWDWSRYVRRGGKHNSFLFYWISWLNFDLLPEVTDGFWEVLMAMSSLLATLGAC